MKFDKMQGCGNDYVYVDVTQHMIQNPEEAARFVSDRHFGVGSDGLILIAKSNVADFRMIMFNLDGSQGKMCGNGIRCVGKFVYDHGMTDHTTITVETLAGIKTLVMTPDENNHIQSVTVDMGEPELIAGNVPVDVSAFQASSLTPNDKVISQPLHVLGQDYIGTAVSMGNLHFIIFDHKNDVRDLDLEKLGPHFEHHKAFPEGVNTEFVNVMDSSHLRMRVWERGSGETMACGTGACAVVTAAIQNGLTERTVDVELLGGHLEISWNPTDNHIYMTGPAVTVFSGEIHIPED